MYEKSLNIVCKMSNGYEELLLKVKSNNLYRSSEILRIFQESIKWIFWLESLI